MSRALDLLAGLVVDDDGTSWGERATDWQRADAEAVIDPDLARYAYLTRPRGGSKTEDAAAIALSLLVVEAPPGSRSYVLAADRDQGALVIDALAGFVRRTPGISGLVKVESWKVVARESGASLSILAADVASSWGISPWLAVIDEIAQWAETRAPRALWESVASAVPKVEGSRLAVLSTAGDPSHWSRAVLDHALGSDRWHVSEVPGPLPWRSEDDLAEQRALLTESAYRRLHENVWCASEDRLTTVDALRDCVTLDGPSEPVAGRRYVVAVDVGLKHDRTAVAVAHRDGERIVLDRIATWEGTRRRPVSLDAVEAWIGEASARYNGARVVLDPFQSAQLMERLRARGVDAVEFVFTAQSVGRLALGMYRRLRDRTLALYDDEALLDELSHVQLRETSPGCYRLDHSASGHDDMAVALALAAEALGQAAQLPEGADAAPAGVGKTSSWRDGGAIVVGSGAGSGRRHGERWPIEAPR